MVSERLLSLGDIELYYHTCKITLLSAHLSGGHYEHELIPKNYSHITCSRSQTFTNVDAISRTLLYRQDDGVLALENTERRDKLEGEKQNKA